MAFFAVLFYFFQIRQIRPVAIPFLLSLALDFDSSGLIAAFRLQISCGFESVLRSFFCLAFGVF